MIKRILLILAFLLAASSAGAGTWDDCAGNTANPNVGKAMRICWNFTDADTTGESTVMFFAVTGLICFDPNTLTIGVDAAQVTLRMCPDGRKPAATPENECFALSTVAMTGIEGSAADQDSCLRVGPGTYYVDIDIAAGAGDTAQVTFRGED